MHNEPSHRPMSRRRQAGSAAIEFGFVFPLLFTIVYSTIAYGYVYFLQQRINFAAEEAVRAAIAVDPGRVSQSAYMAAVTTAVNAAVQQNFTTDAGATTLPAALTVLPLQIIASNTGNTVQITLNYSLISPVLFPTVTLPLIGAIPPLPDLLAATAAGKL